MSKCLLPVSLLVGTCLGDVYMQNPSGSNNRLDEGGGNRNNNNRLMDTQNNAKGGYGYGGDAGNKAAPLNFIHGSQMSMSWTSQHSCGTGNAECQMVIQYMCNDLDANGARTAPVGVPYTNAADANGVGEGPIRDGTDNGTPDPDDPNQNRGLHEPASFYQACDNRARNQNLYTADQNINGDDARRTRQNPNGDRSGLECPEERDYYPYWAPSPWMDLMVMTNNLDNCDTYRAASQNVEAKGYCTGATNNNNDEQPITETECTAQGGTWAWQEPFNIPPPDCVAAPVQRDNHLGNAQSGNEVLANFSMPNPGVSTLTAATDTGDRENCVIRLRYNITTGDTQVCEDPTHTTRDACINSICPTGLPCKWSSLFTTDNFNDGQNPGPNGVIIEGLETATNTNSEEAGLPQQDEDISLGGFLNDAGDTGDSTDSLLELAINTNQYGRTFQDRTHVFSLQSRPATIPDNQMIFNLNVKGKRGNIVQTYPATEYDFHPSPLITGSSDMVHIQWTGNDNTDNNGNNNGEGTNNEDRHNIVQIAASGMDVAMAANQANMFDLSWEMNMEPSTSTFGGVRDQAELTKQFALAKQTGCDADPNNDQDGDNCQKLNAAAAKIDMGLLTFKPGTYEYMSSRNNNFSNRAQKASLTTVTTSSIVPEPPSHVQVTPIETGSSSNAGAHVTWAKAGAEVANIGFDRQEYWGMSQSHSVASAYAYKVMKSCDGGATWQEAEGCEYTSNEECDVTGLLPGTACLIEVFAMNAKEEWSSPSAVAVVQTFDSALSAEMRQALQDELDGKTKLSAGDIVAIVVGVLAFLICVGFIVFLIKRRQPPPPPPPQFAEMAKPDA